MKTYAIPPAEEAAIRGALLESAMPGPLRGEWMAGIPAAGKTEFVEQAMAGDLFPKGAFILDPDRVMDALRIYHDDYRKLGPSEAFERWQLPCRQLAQDMAREAMRRKLPVICDMGMARQSDWDLMKEFKEAGYPLTLHVIQCPVDMAEADSLKRPRLISAGMIRERSIEIPRLLRENQDIPDRIFWYERAANKRFVEVNAP